MRARGQAKAYVKSVLGVSERVTHFSGNPFGWQLCHFITGDS